MIWCWKHPRCVTSHCSLHSAPVFRLLLAVAVNGTHQRECLTFCGTFCPDLHILTDFICVDDAPGQTQRTNVAGFELRSLMLSMPCLIVLVQDLCYSDPLSLVLTFLTHATAVGIRSLVAALPSLCILCMPLMFRSQQPQTNIHQRTSETQTQTHVHTRPHGAPAVSS